MKPKNTTYKKNNYLWLSISFSVLLPMLLGLVLSNYLSNWNWIHYPFHSLVESIGALSALTIATLMILMVNNNNLPKHYIWVACALIGMGILDGFHATLHAGTSFVWLHSVATLIGGLTFAAIFSSKSWQLTAKRQKALISSVITISILISLFSTSFPNFLPNMVVQGEFSLLAKILNIIGGIGFLIGSAYFIFHRLRDKRLHSNEPRQNEDIILANHCLLFGIAGLLFEFSIIWDAGWWWWHILRLAAYLVVLLYIFSLFKYQQDLLKKNKIELSNTNKNLGRRVYERTKELEKANQVKSDFLANMSHELRTPLNAILGFAQILEQDEKLHATQKDSINEILLAGRHLVEIVSDILDLSRIEGGKLDINMEDTNISLIITDSMTSLAPLAEENNIQLINNTSSKDDFFVHVDRLRFKQVIINLLSNAIKYNCNNGKVFVEINIINNKNIRISFKDTGLGISKDKQKKLFMQFERLGHETGDIAGTGIGLVFSKKLVELMDGYIGMHSEENKGSTFFVEFSYADKK